MIRMLESSHRNFQISKPIDFKYVLWFSNRQMHVLLVDRRCSVPSDERTCGTQHHHYTDIFHQLNSNNGTIVSQVADMQRVAIVNLKRRPQLIFQVLINNWEANDNFVQDAIQCHSDGRSLYRWEKSNCGNMQQRQTFHHNFLQKSHD